MRSMEQRVVVTGIGVVSPNGIGRERFWKNLVEGYNAIRRISRFDVSHFASQMGGEVNDFVCPQEIPEAHRLQMDRAYMFGVASAIQAVEDAGMDFSRENPSRVGVYMGVGIGGVDRTEKELAVLRQKGASALRPNLYQNWFPSASSGYISLHFGLHGQSHVLSTGCTSSADAIGLAAESIRTGQEDIVIAGGTEAPIMPLTLNSFCAMRAISSRNQDPEHASRPFDRERDGFVLAEGGAALLLESFAHARARGARIFAELAGYGTTSNAYHMTAPDPSGEMSARAIRIALDDAEVAPAEIGYVSAHGSSTPLNEKAETHVIKRAFGEHARRLVVSSIKSMIGHTLGAAGVMQAAATALAVQEGIVPPTINYEYPDPDCDLDVVPNSARQRTLNAALAISAGFSGKNSALIFKPLGPYCFT